MSKRNADDSPTNARKKTRSSKGKGKQTSEEYEEEGRKELFRKLVNERRLKDLQKEVFGKGALKTLHSASIDWEDTTPKFSEFPEGWLNDDLSSGLRHQHLFPNCYRESFFYNRDSFGNLQYGSVADIPREGSPMAIDEDDELEFSREGNVDFSAGDDYHDPLFTPERSMGPNEASESEDPPYIDFRKLDLGLHTGPKLKYTSIPGQEHPNIMPIDLPPLTQPKPFLKPTGVSSNRMTPGQEVQKIVSPVKPLGRKPNLYELESGYEASSQGTPGNPSSRHEFLQEVVKFRELLKIKPLNTEGLNKIVKKMSKSQHIPDTKFIQKISDKDFLKKIEKSHRTLVRYIEKMPEPKHGSITKFHMKLEGWGETLKTLTGK